jgi:thiol:disulfide interchange protein
MLRWCLFAALGGCGTTDLAHATLPYAIDAASEAHRPLIIELSATWCKPCHVFATQVLTDPRVKEALRDVLFVSYDIDTPNGRDAMQRCRVRGVPAVLGIDHEGVVRLEKLGTEPTADEFLVFMRQAHAVLGTPAQAR